MKTNKLRLRVLLSFSDAQYERAFIAHYVEFYRRYAQVSLLLGVVLVFGDFLVDYFAHPGVRANFFRVWICVPVLFAGLGYSFLQQAKRNWQSTMSAFVVAVALILFWILLLMDQEGGPGLKTWVGVLNFTFLELYCFVILGVQFRFALVAGIVILVAFESAMWFGFAMEKVQVAYWTYHVVTVFILAAAIGWWREYLLRLEYLARMSLDEARQSAEHMTKTKSDFLANMSHEIRTPMNGVLGMTELLLTTDLTERQRAFAEILNQSGIALLKVINDVLDFSKIEAGKVELEHIDFDLYRIMEAAVGLLAESAQTKHIELILHVEEAIPSALRGDPGRLHQILTNLIANAIKFTDKGEVVVQAQMERDEGTRALMRFEVVDTGIGIEPDAQALIFDTFSQADGGTTRKYGGTGLGLAICKNLVGLFEGEIGVNSRPGSGSTFWLVLPFEKQPLAIIGAAAHSPSLSDLRVLVVDDNATNRDVLCGQLAALGLRADGAASAQHALDAMHAAAGSDPYRIAVVDVQMPGTDGLELSRLIRRDPALEGVDLLLLSPISQDVSTQTLRELSVRGWLTKPVSRRQLSDCLAGFGQTGDPVPVASDAAATARVKQPNGHLLRVLVVDDNPANQKVAKAMVEALGHRCDLAASGYEALEAIARQSYDVVLMDCQMPEMDGFQATRELRRREATAGSSRLPVVALTGHALAGDREQCLAAGMDAYLAKPFRMAQLRDAIKCQVK